jgi:hypothetical protein
LGIARTAFISLRPTTAYTIVKLSVYPIDETIRFAVAPTIIYGDESFVTIEQEKGD